eukprot:9813459-Alexandrium_andersonii.AAC.1
MGPCRPRGRLLWRSRADPAGPSPGSGRATACAKRRAWGARAPGPGDGHPPGDRRTARGPPPELG